jgi:hypothetical protein
MKEIAPDATIKNYVTDEQKIDAEKILEKGCRIVLIPDVHTWHESSLFPLIEKLNNAQVTVVLPSDLSEETGPIQNINRVHELGAITVGRVNRQSLVMKNQVEPFNKRLREIKTDIFSTVGMTIQNVAPVASVAGTAALIVQKWPEFSASEIRKQLISRARKVWQGTSIETGQWQIKAINIDPITTEYKVKDEKKIFRFNVLDAASCLEVDTKMSWPLNMLNVHKAWEITKGTGIIIAVSDSGFHLNHPELVGRIADKAQFGPIDFDRPNQEFHGTDMSRIALSVAPEAKIAPLLCSAQWTNKRDEYNRNLAINVSKSFLHAKERNIDIITSSWAGWFNKDENLLSIFRQTADSGVVVSWIHYPNDYPGILRSSFVYTIRKKYQLGFADRFLKDEPGFHPVEIEAGLSGTAPQAAGIAALVKSVNPQLSPKEIKDIILENSTPIGEGVHIPDAYLSVLAAQKLTEK